MHLKTLLAGLSLRSATADMETEITHISYDSRTTAPGDVFVAMTGFAKIRYARIFMKITTNSMTDKVTHYAVTMRFNILLNC